MQSASPGRPIRLIQLSDTHLFADPAQHLEWGQLMPANPAAGLRQVLQHLQRRQPRHDAIIVTGDVAQYPSAATYESIRQHFAAAAPSHFLPGNHDDRQLMRAAAAAGHFSMPDHVELGNWVLLLLDSCVDGENHGRLSATSLMQLQQRLQQFAGRHVLIALHHPPMALGSRWLDRLTLENSAEFLALISRFAAVKVVISGHAHQSKQHRIGELLLTTCPSTTLQFTPASDEIRFCSRGPAFRELLLLPDGQVWTEVHYLDARAGQRAAYSQAAAAGDWLQA